MIPAYPASFAGLGEWARAAEVPVNEARVRFAQFAILQVLAASRQLREGLVFKGGNALDFIWQPNRSTSDLDFSVDHDVFRDTPDVALIKALLERAVTAGAPGVGVAMRVTRVRAQPPGEGRTFVTYQARLTYALPDEPRLRLRLEQGEPIAQGIDLDISINEPICAASWVAVSPDSTIRVATLENIAAEKLRALATAAPQPSAPARSSRHRGHSEWASGSGPQPGRPVSRNQGRRPKCPGFTQCFPKPGNR